MTDAIRALLSLTRHSGRGRPAPGLCADCVPADIRAELASLSHADDIDRLAAPGQANGG